MTSSNKLTRALLASAAFLSPMPALAQETPDAPPPATAATDQADAAPGDAEDAADEAEIVITGQRDPNAVIGDIPPENTLGARDIRAYGAATVAELLDAIAPQTQSGRGRDGGPPVVLVNGRRTSGFREIRDLPPEAILRLDILPEEVALKYGYRADQRVVNIILRPRFRSTTARAEAEMPTEGGRVGIEADATRLMIGEKGRTSISGRVESTSGLLESERDILPPADPSAIDPRPFRSLGGERQLARVGATLNRPLFGKVSTTLDGQVEVSGSQSLLGPSLSLDPGTALARDSDATSARAGFAMNGDKGKWRWSLNGGYDWARSVTRTDRDDSDPATDQRDRARSTSGNGAIDAVASGPFLELPAGAAQASVRLGASTRDLDSVARRGLAVTQSNLGRDRLSSALNLDLPVSRRGKDIGALGNLTLNANAEVEELSDFGTLTTVGGGLFWSPFKALNLIASFTQEEGAPSLNQLGDPLLTTPGTRIFDFQRGETAVVELVSGGNEALAADTRRVMKLGATVRPSEKLDLELRADFTSARIDDPIARFPGPTAAIEAAFPERFTRGSAGQLLRVDLRPVNYDRAAKDELRWGFNFFKPLRSARPSESTINALRDQMRARGLTPPARPGGSGEDAPPAPPPAEGERQTSDAPGGGGGGFRGRGSGGRGFGGGGGGFGGGRNGGRLQLSVYHTIALKDDVRIREGLPVLDYLDGEAGEGGARPRHRLDVDAGYFNNGLGARLSANWQSGTTVTGGSSGNLDFAPIAKINVNLFANLGDRLDLVARRPWLRGTQVRLGIQNLFDTKQRVRDAFDKTPVNYQPDLLDPQGRTISISIRKLFTPLPSFGRGGGGGRRGEGR